MARGTSHPGLTTTALSVLVVAYTCGTAGAFGPGNTAAAALAARTPVAEAKEGRLTSPRATAPAADHHRSSHARQRAPVLSPRPSYSSAHTLRLRAAAFPLHLVRESPAEKEGRSSRHTCTCQHPRDPVPVCVRACAGGCSGSSSVCCNNLTTITSCAECIERPQCQFFGSGLTGGSCSTYVLQHAVDHAPRHNQGVHAA